jgi:hypothetical protein
MASVALLGGIRGKSVTANMFYTSTIMNLYVNQTMQNVFSALINATYNADNPLYTHPFGKLDSSFPLPYLDRFGFRLPSWIPPVTTVDGHVITPELGLGLHLDMNPFNPFLFDSGNSCLPKWRPFQSFVTVTDHMMEEHGGLCVVPGFHRHINTFFQVCDSRVKMETAASHNGEFFRMNHYSGSDLDTIPVKAPPGSLVLWDVRLPHKTTRTCQNPVGRMQIYGSWLPDVDINRKYCDMQRRHFLSGILPPSEHSNALCYKSSDLRLNSICKKYFTEGC